MSLGAGRHWEYGTRTIGARYVLRMAQVLGINVETLLAKVL